MWVSVGEAGRGGVQQLGGWRRGAQFLRANLIPQPQGGIWGGDEDAAVESGSPGPGAPPSP